MKSSREFKSKLLISTIKILVPNFEKTFYLNIIINEDKTFKTKSMDFKKTNTVDINQVFELEGINSIDVIKFQIYEKSSIFSNALFKGEVRKNNLIKDEFSNQLVCFLSNNNQENCAVVYYNYEVNPDLIETFDQNLKKLEEEQMLNAKNEQKSYFGNLKELAKGENAENFSKFVHNMEYYRSVENWISDFINWRNSWKTLCIMLIYTYSVMYWKISTVILPLVIIYLHVYNRDTMQVFSHRDTKHDNLANMTLITKTIENTNLTINFYENILEALQHSDKKVYEEIYVNLLKMVVLNFFIIYFRMVSIQFILLVPLWSVILWKNPSFRAFVIFLINFIQKKFIDSAHPSGHFARFVNVTKKVFFTVIPFANIVRKVYKIRNEIITNSGMRKSTGGKGFKEVFESTCISEVDSDVLQGHKTVVFSNDLNGSLKNSNSQELLKFELYENERWWMFVGWAKNLIMNERPLWSDISGKNYMDKNSVFLPNSDYQWMGDWKVEATDNCDAQGWEYASDFNSDFGSKPLGKYVRRRKWVRYAKKQ